MRQFFCILRMLTVFIVLPGLGVLIPPSAHAQTYVYLTQWGSAGTGNGQFINPGSVAVDGSGDVYVADRSNGRIQKFTSDGTFILAWGGLFTPTGLAVDGSGNVYVADFSNARILKFTSTGTFLTSWTTGGTAWGVAVDGSGYVYVVDPNANRVQKFGSDGVLNTEWGSFGNGAGQFYIPDDVAVGGSGHVYVADTYNNRFQEFTGTGMFLGARGGYPSGQDGWFNYPEGIAVDASGSVYMADTGNNRIQEFNSAFGFVLKWGSTGSGAGQFKRPMDVAVDGSGNVYVADADNHRIQVFGLGWTVTASAGLNGSIDPTGPVVVLHGGSQQFAITADAGYHVEDVVVDGGSVGPQSTYTFTNITANHTITATFAYTVGVGDGRSVQFALRGVLPNPTGREFRVNFSLKDTQPATLSLFDIHGRQLSTRRVDDLGPGWHTVALGDPGDLRAGLYLIRLTQDGRSLTTRAALVR